MNTIIIFSRVVGGPYWNDKKETFISAPLESPPVSLGGRASVLPYGWQWPIRRFGRVQEANGLLSISCR
jgi:hypothetical protein